MRNQHAVAAIRAIGLNAEDLSLPDACGHDTQEVSGLR
jgi:hypothetical protein